MLGVQADPRSPEHGQYGFLQDLVRHVAYETLSKRERRAEAPGGGRVPPTRVRRRGERDRRGDRLALPRRLPRSPRRRRRRGDQAQRPTTTLVRAGERAASLGAAAEARRYFEGGGADRRPARAGRRCSAGPATWRAARATPTAAWQLLERVDRALRGCGRHARGGPGHGAVGHRRSASRATGTSCLERTGARVRRDRRRRARRGSRRARGAPVPGLLVLRRPRTGRARGPSSRWTSPRRRGCPAP